MTISGFIAYAIQTWKNKPDTSTPLSAARLAHIEAGIKANSDAITKLAAAVINQQANDVNKIPSSALMYSVNEKVDSAISDLNEGKYFRAYTSAFVFGKSIAANSKDNTFDFNISARGFATKPGIFILVPAVAKLTNIRYDYDNSTAQVAKIIFDNEGALISADTYVRVGVIAIE